MGREIGSGEKFLDRYERDLQEREDKKWKIVEKVVFSSEVEAKLRKCRQDLLKAKCQHKFEMCLRIENDIKKLIEEGKKLGRRMADARKTRLVDEHSKLGGAKARAVDRLLLTLKSELAEAMENDDFELCIHLRERIIDIESGKVQGTSLKPFRRTARNKANSSTLHSSSSSRSTQRPRAQALSKTTKVLRCNV